MAVKILIVGEVVEYMEVIEAMANSVIDFQSRYYKLGAEIAESELTQDVKKAISELFDKLQLKTPTIIRMAAELIAMASHQQLEHWKDHPECNTDVEPTLPDPQKEAKKFVSELTQKEAKKFANELTKILKKEK